MIEKIKQKVTLKFEQNKESIVIYLLVLADVQTFFDKNFLSNRFRH